MRLLVAGSNGQLGRELVRKTNNTDAVVLALDLPDLDITDMDRVREIVEDFKPRMVINAAAYTQVDQAEKEPEPAFAVNRDGPARLAAVCSDRAVPLIHVSTDFVFDGNKSGLYVESDPVAPLGEYGRSKAAGEEAVRSGIADHIIVRTAWLYSVHGHNFLKTILRLAGEKEELRVVADQHGCPTAAADLADAVLAIAGRVETGGPVEWGTYHYCGKGATTWHGFAEAIIDTAREHKVVKTERVIPITTAEYPLPAKRPANSALDCTRIETEFGIRARDWRKSLESTIRELLTESE